ncbi:MAG: hypothetical protein ABIH53_00075 [archaeon]
MERKIIILIIGLLLLLPLAIAVDTITDGNTDTTQTEDDLSEICDSYSLIVDQDKSFTYCDTAIELTFDPSTGDLTINDNPIEIGDSYESDGLTVITATYEGFETGKATLTLTKSFEKVLGSFEEKKFKVFYDEDAQFAKSVDATTDFLAQITYEANNAYIKIRSSTPSQITLGINFESADKTEKLHIPWNISHTNIQALLEEKIETSEESLFDFIADDNALTLTLGSIDYKIELAPMPGHPEINAIKISSLEQFQVAKGNILKDTDTIWITTKLADISPDEKACKYNIGATGSLDDFTRASSVEGYYPSATKFFDTFTDYCKDETTLVNYGCVGLNTNWKETSRVAFLEVTCPNCADGACEEGPYCIETDKYAPLRDQTVLKGTLKIYEPRTRALTNIGDYESGIKLVAVTETHVDSCADGELIEYKCDANAPEGYTITTAPCDSGNCVEGACTGEPIEVIEEVEEESVIEGSQVRDELIELRDMITLLENAYEPVEESWWGGLWETSDREITSVEAPSVASRVSTGIRSFAARLF